MTSKERVLLAVSHRQPDRAPVDYAAHPALHRALLEHLGLPPDADMAQVLELDLRGVGPCIKSEATPVRYADPTAEVRPDGVLLDLWGVGFKRTTTPTGEYIDLAYAPLAGIESDDAILAHPMMSPDDWDYANVGPDAQAQSSFAVWAHCRGTFEISWFIRGLDGFLTDLAIAPGRACALMDRVQEPLLERLRRILDAGGGAIDMVEYNDDVGGQKGLVMSPDMWRKHLKPRIGRVFDLIRGYGKVVRYHSCGGVRGILPDLIDLGLQVLNPVQPLATGMEPVALKRDFGRHITLHGGIDMQHLLPRESASRVRDEVRRLADKLGRDGGWIACSSHSLQPDTPPANVVTMYEVLLGRALK